MYFECYSLSDAFMQLRRQLFNSSVVETRGFITREIMPAQIKIHNPRARLFYHPARKYNLAFNIAEVLSYVGGINSVKYLGFFNKNIAKYSDDGETFYGAYGPRISKYLQNIVAKLKQDNGSRQTIITIYNSNDMLVDTKDVPCTIALQFAIRNNKLNLHVMMRSNDLIWGFQYDMFSFSVIQEIIANELGIDVGDYYHTTTSLHVYDYHWKLLEQIDKFDAIVMPKLYSNISNFIELANVSKHITESDEYDPYANYDYIDGELLDVLEAYKCKKLGVPRDLYINIVPDWAKKFV